MFFVNDTQENRHKFIEGFLNEETLPIAVLLAAVDFEWTLRRAILALGMSPTKHIHEVVLNRVSGLWTYSKKWDAEVKARLHLSLQDVVPDWDGLVNAFRLRGELVHGASGTVKSETGKTVVDRVLAASKALETYAIQHDNTLYRRIDRRKPRGATK